MPDVFNAAGEKWCPTGQHWVAPDGWGSGRVTRCTACNGRYAREWRERNQEWLNAKRREGYAKRAGPLERRCEICNELYAPTRRDSKTCSSECRSKLSYLYRKARKLDRAA